MSEKSISPNENGLLNIDNAEKFDTFQPSPEVSYKVKERIDSVRFYMKSIEEQYARLKKMGLAIDITNPEIYEGGKRPTDGIFSPLFGADTTQDTPVYTCDCHKLTGGSNLGRFCEKCQSYVRTIEADLRIPGFIDIAPYHILTFHGYNAFSKLFKNLDTIITTSKQITRSGKIKDDGLPTIMDLYDDYEELYADKIGLPIDVVFTSKIPVYSSRMRPLISNNSTITLLKINQHLLSLVKLANIIRTAVIIPDFRRDIEVQKTLNAIQQDFNEVCKIVVDQCNTKAGVFRRTMASGRLDNSSRMVIVLGLGLHSYEVDMPYQTMMSQYEEEIANYLMKQEGVNLSTAINMIRENACEVNPYFVTIIRRLLRRGHGLWVLVNRNPTISKSGILYMRIRDIHDDPNDYTLHLPQDILTLLGADFDGDQVTSVCVKNPKYHALFINMCPTYAYINRSDGKFNPGMGFGREYSALLSALWDNDWALNQYLSNPEEDSYDVMRKYGIDFSPTNEHDHKQLYKFSAAVTH